MDNFNCETCNYHCNWKSHWEQHLSSKKHNNNGVIKRKEKENKFQGKCSFCDYTTNQEISFNTHLLTKHSNKTDRKNNFKFYCILCDYGTFNINMWNKHNNNKKHLHLISINN
jgi:hypothetical protein